MTMCGAPHASPHFPDGRAAQQKNQTERYAFRKESLRSGWIGNLSPIMNRLPESGEP
jgi:hypothetical protein